MNIACTQRTEAEWGAIGRRRELFLIALGNARLTQSGWAKAHGITPSHLSHVLSGARDSNVLCAKIDAFTEKHLASPRALAS